MRRRENILPLHGGNLPLPGQLPNISRLIKFNRVYVRVRVLIVIILKKQNTRELVYVER